MTTPPVRGRRAAAGVDVLELGLDDSWLRDCGPIYVADAEGRVGVHFRFNAWGEKFPPWDRDAAVGRLVAEALGDRVVERPDRARGRDRSSATGTGTLLTTEQCLLHPNRNPELSRAADRGDAALVPRPCSALCGSGRGWWRIATPTATSI